MVSRRRKLDYFVGRISNTAVSGCCRIARILGHSLLNDVVQDAKCDIGRRIVAARAAASQVQRISAFPVRSCSARA